MKIILLLIMTAFASFSFSQTYPRFNPLVDINKSRTFKQVLSQLSMFNEFRLHSNSDSQILGTYQNQAIVISRAMYKGGWTTPPDSSFKIVITFNSNRDYEIFLSAGRQFFTQTGHTFSYLHDFEQLCTQETFAKMDFKLFPIDVIFTKCSDKHKKPVYLLSFDPYRSIRCGNE